MKIQQLVLGILSQNCYFLTDDATGETAVIDPGQNSSKLVNLTDKIGAENIKYILLTHNHWDHIGGIPKLKELAPDAKIAIHELDAPKLSQVDILLQDGDKLPLGALEISVLHTPGHTCGGCCYLTEDVILTGDTVFHENVGRTDMEGGSYSELMKSVQKIKKLAAGEHSKDRVILPGHGESSSLSHEIKFNPYFRR